MAAPLVCTFDASEAIVSVGVGWDAFARENGVPALTAATVVGRPLWDYVAGAEAQHLWRTIFMRARQGTMLKLPFRCDSPRLRRFSEMEIAGSGDGQVICTSHILLEEVRPRVDLLDPAVPRLNDVVVICSWCKRVQLNRTWVEVEQAVDEWHLFDRERQPQLNHACCPNCAQSVVR